MSEDESSANVLQVCFDEIDKARPFFIAILGDAYGWIPKSDVIKKSMFNRNIIIEDLLGKSVTEMEQGEYKTAMEYAKKAWYL